MFVYLDESYNLQKKKGELFISINGFVVVQNKKLRSHWVKMRRPYVRKGQRIHAWDTKFEDLRHEGLKLLVESQALFLTCFQSVILLPYEYFDKDGLLFEKIYVEILLDLIGHIDTAGVRDIRIVVDSRQKKRFLGERIFLNKVKESLDLKFFDINYTFETAPSYRDILLELADFVSNSMYKRYRNDSVSPISIIDFPSLLQIKNPLSGIQIEPSGVLLRHRDTPHT